MVVNDGSIEKNLLHLLLRELIEKRINQFYRKFRPKFRTKPWRNWEVKMLKSTVKIYF